LLGRWKRLKTKQLRDYHKKKDNNPGSPAKREGHPQSKLRAIPKEKKPKQIKKDIHGLEVWSFMSM